MAQKCLPIRSIIANHGEKDGGKDDDMIQGGGGQDGEIIDQPKRYVQREEEAADPGFFLHDAEREAPNGHHGDKIEGAGGNGGAEEADHRDGAIAYHEGGR